MSYLHPQLLDLGTQPVLITELFFTPDLAVRIERKRSVDVLRIVLTAAAPAAAPPEDAIARRFQSAVRIHDELRRGDWTTEKACQAVECPFGRAAHCGTALPATVQSSGW
jgi:hypothetical protein